MKRHKKGMSATALFYAMAELAGHCKFVGEITAPVIRSVCNKYHVQVLSQEQIAVLTQTLNEEQRVVTYDDALQLRQHLSDQATEKHLMADRRREALANLRETFGLTEEETADLEITIKEKQHKSGRAQNTLF